MRTLNYNKIKDNSSITATNEDGNNPIRNIYHRHLKLYFMATANTSLITINWAADQTFNALAIGYHNANSLSVVLKDSSGVTIDTLAITPLQTLLTDEDGTLYKGTDIAYFDQTYTGVRSIEITAVTTDSMLFIGGLSAGIFLQWPYADKEPEYGLEDNSSFSKTPGGQINGEDAVILDEIRTSFPVVTKQQFDGIVAVVKANKSITPLYLDRYEGDRTKGLPLYCNITRAGGGERSVRNTYRLSFIFEECR